MLSSLTTCDPANIYELITVPTLGPPLEAPRRALLTRLASPLEPEGSEGAGVGDRPVGGGARVHRVDQGDGRLLPRHPG